jgi:hypothetical protein
LGGGLLIWCGAALLRNGWQCKHGDQGERDQKTTFHENSSGGSSPLSGSVPLEAVARHGYYYSLDAKPQSWCN